MHDSTMMLLSGRIADETWVMTPTGLMNAIENARIGKKPTKTRMPRVDGNIAILPVFGPISQRNSIWSEIFGGTATESLSAAYLRAMNDDRVGGVVFDVDSPGGTIWGVETLSSDIHASRSQKPTIAIANSLAASAAYWIGSSAGQFAAAPGADVGAIGAYRVHQDRSKQMDELGVSTTFLAAPEFKVEGNPFEALSAAAVEHHMRQVEMTYDAFNTAVARNRDVSPAAARENFGKGRLFKAEQAVEMGLVDRVATLPQILEEMGAARGGSSAISAQRSAAIQDSLCAAWESGQPGQVKRGPTRSIRRRRLSLLQRD